MKPLKRITKSMKKKEKITFMNSDIQKKKVSKIVVRCITL